MRTHSYVYLYSKRRIVELTEKLLPLCSNPAQKGQTNRHDSLGWHIGASKRLQREEISFEPPYPHSQDGNGISEWMRHTDMDLTRSTIVSGPETALAMIHIKNTKPLVPWKRKAPMSSSRTTFLHSGSGRTLWGVWNGILCSERSEPPHYFIPTGFFRKFQNAHALKPSNRDILKNLFRLSLIYFALS